VGVVKSAENKKRVAGQFAVKYQTETLFWISKEKYGITPNLISVRT
jgi:hypothetical protein